MKKTLTFAVLALVAAPAAGEGLGPLVTGGDAGLELRYRYEGVEQADKPASADAQTLRLRLNLASGAVGGFSGFVELDHLEGLGGERYDDTRNGLTRYPVIADPEGTDLNQLWLQFKGGKDTLLRVGRQRILLDNERFVAPVGWRLNEQTFDALRLETQALAGAAIFYGYIDAVQRVFGPDAGVPPERLRGDSHVLNVKLAPLPAGSLSFYGYLLDFDNAPQLSSDTFGARYEGDRALREGLKLGWSLEYAVQRDAGANAARIDAHYALVELRLLASAAGLTAGREVLSGERGVFDAATNPAFQTPLATLHKFQGWADKFLTTPSAGIEDLYLGLGLRRAGWNGQIVWHDFAAEATAADYGAEWDASVSRQFAKRYELVVKYADYSADGLFTDTRKFWVQIRATF